MFLSPDQAAYLEYATDVDYDIEPDHFIRELELEPDDDDECGELVFAEPEPEIEL